MNKIYDKSAPHGAGVGSPPTEAGDMKKTAREDLYQIYHDLEVEKERILRKLPQKDQIRLIELDIKMDRRRPLFLMSDEELEAEALFEREYRKKCPLFEELDAPVKEDLDPCTQPSCPRHPACWHAQGKPYDDSDPFASELMLKLQNQGPRPIKCNFYDDEKHPCPHISHADGCHREDCDDCKIYENSPGRRPKLE